MSKSILAEAMEQVQALGDEDSVEAKAQIMSSTTDLIWVPNPGPQTKCYLSVAYLTLYGGAGGGGKTDLILGLAFNEHHRSLIMRRKYTDLGALTERAIEINGSRDGFSGSAPPKLRRGGQLIEFGAAKDAGDEQSWQGQPHDLLGVDEAAQWAESQIRYLMGWVRTTKPGQRTRIVLASNPPLSEEGAWLIKMFAPWLDPQHPNPALPGELRYFLTDAEGVDIEVDGPGPHPIADRQVTALSRTFIPADVTDNPYYAGTEYEHVLDALLEPLRSAIRDGNFGMARRDHDLQLIPTEWIRLAMERWKKHPKPPEGVPMCAIGVDVAQGGTHKSVLSPRYDGWYAPLIKIPGVETPYGSDLAGRIVKFRKDPAVVVIDMGGGYGGSTFEHLKENEIPVVGHKGAEKSVVRTKERQLGFHNKRAEVYWRFREALDPEQTGGSPIFLPPDPILLSDLCAIRLMGLDYGGIRLESKKEMEKRLGRSTDDGDSVVIAWSAGQKALTHAAMWGKGEMGGRVRNRSIVITGRESVRRNVRR